MQTVMCGTVVMHVPVHQRPAFVDQLNAVHADVLASGLGMAGDHQRQGHESAGIIGPALQNRQISQPAMRFGDFAGHAGANGFGSEFAHSLEIPGHFERFTQRDAGRARNQGINALGDRVQIGGFQGQVGPFAGAEQVDGNRVGGVSHLFAQHRRPA